MCRSDNRICRFDFAGAMLVPPEELFGSYRAAQALRQAAVTAQNAVTALPQGFALSGAPDERQMLSLRMQKTFHASLLGKRF